MINTRKWTVRFNTENGNKYENVIGFDIRKVIDWICKEYGIESKDIDYVSSEEVIIID